MPIVHTVVFQRTYEKFWQDYTRVPLLWVSQLFSLLAIGSLIYETSDVVDSSAPVPLRNQMFRASAQALVLANWERPQKDVVEALFFYTIAKLVAGTNPSCDVDEVCTRDSYECFY